jgi:hypothetical protein
MVFWGYMRWGKSEFALQQKSMHGHQVLADDRMLLDHPTSFHQDRGIGQGDTPSTLIFIAVCDILLTLLEDSDAGEAHAYADDLLTWHERLGHSRGKQI